MALKAGRVGVNPNYVDKDGRPLYDNSYLKELLRKEGIITLFTKEGNPISIDNAVAGRVYDLVVNMSPKQAGTGTPSPTNPRAISGYSSITIDVNSLDTEVSLGSTVFYGTLDLITGVLTVTHAYVADMSALTWEKNTTVTHAFNGALTTAARSKTLSAICSKYEVYDSNDLNESVDYGFAMSFNGLIVYVRNKDCTEIADIESALSGVQLVYELATPTTVQLTAQAIALTTGSNTVSSDIGTTMDLKYLGTLVPGGANGRSLNRSLNLNREVIDSDARKGSEEEPGEIKEEVNEEIKEEVPEEKPVTTKKSTKKTSTK